ncbi:MAG: mandelate racemase/muconate lactonizing enzyme family protein [Bryobacterales bacterium]|nr:mandelate racemase/muconate lactonizing enzyme family protein [Bryobacterales bacterium]
MPRLSRRHALGLAGLAALPLNAAGRSERLTITRIDLYKVVVPMKADSTTDPETAESSRFDLVPKIIMEIHSDSGLVGIGETGRGEDEAGVARNAASLKGRNALDLNLTHLDLPVRAGYAAFEMALYDLVGKAFSWPVYRLLGGLAQRKVLVGYWTGRRTPKGMIRVAERAVAGKFTSVKTKCKQGDPVVETAEILAKHAPGIKYIVDPNTRFNSYADFLKVAKPLDAIGNCLVFEDPFNKSDYEGYRNLRKQVKTHVALHLGDPKAMIRAIQEDACSVFNTGGNPGMSSFVANAYLAGAAGRPVWHGSGNDCGIVDASYLHSCAAAPNCTLPSDILSFLREDDLIVEPIPIKESYATVSDRPGLGVDLDKDAIRRYQVKS